MTPTQSVDQLEQFGLESQQYVLFVSRLIPHKRAHDLVAAFSKLETNLKLVIVGDGSYTDEYVAELKQRASGDERVVFTGYQTGETLHQLYSNARAFVQPSESEGLSVAVLEAGSYGLPVIVSDIPANTEIVGDLGWVFPMSNVDRLAQVLAEVINNADEAQQRGQALRRRITHHYNWETIATQTDQVYMTRRSLVDRLHEKAVRHLNKKEATI